jgi:hypothetical protein
LITACVRRIEARPSEITISLTTEDGDATSTSEIEAGTVTVEGIATREA